ncbi:MAG: ABC transporter substrate-binding protein [Anaerolineae bacterium]|nr:MAG: ABC transporter substrate-binding protein [Anaerolineae bacterium]
MPTPFDFVPHRVISLVPSMTESLFDLGIGDRVIAVTDYCTRPEQQLKHLPRIGGTKNPDIARIIDLQPDLVLMNREENRREDKEALDQAGIKTWVTHPGTVFEALNLLWDIMDVFEAPQFSARVREIERSYDYTEGAMRAQRLVSVFVPIWKDPWMTINKETYIHDLLSVCGGQNVFAERERMFPLRAEMGQAEPMSEDDERIRGKDTRYPRITLEEMVEKQPEVVLLPDEPYPFTEEHASIFYALDIPAAKNGHIYTVDGSLLSWHGTRIAYALQELPPIFDKVRREIDENQL